MQIEVFNSLAQAMYRTYPDEAWKIESVCDSVYEAIDAGADSDEQAQRGVDVLSELTIQFDESAVSAYWANMSRAERLGWMKARDANVD